MHCDLLTWDCWGQVAGMGLNRTKSHSHKSSSQVPAPRNIPGADHYPSTDGAVRCVFYSEEPKCSLNPITFLIWQGAKGKTFLWKGGAFCALGFVLGAKCFAHLSRQQVLCQASRSRQSQAWSQGRMGELRNSWPKCQQQPQQQSIWKDTDTGKHSPFKQRNW